MSTLKRRPMIGIIANSTSPSNREDLIKELGQPKNDLFNPLRFSYKEFKGEIIPIDIQPNDVLKTEGFFKGKEAMFKAVDYLVNQGAQIICFTASTKRLAGKSGKDIKKLYPNHTFTMGDNATNISFSMILENIMTDLNKDEDEVVCVGDGYLGGIAIATFLKYGFKNINVVSEQTNKYNSSIKVVDKVEKLPKNIKLMASCSHKYEPDKDVFKNLFAPGAFIVEVAVPPMVKEDLYQCLNDDINKFDAGDFYLPHIEYHFPAHILSFPEKGYWFGCWTEAVMLGLAHYDGYDIKAHDFYEINDENRSLIMHYLQREEVQVPFINFFDPKVVEKVELI